MLGSYHTKESKGQGNKEDLHSGGWSEFTTWLYKTNVLSSDDSSLEIKMIRWEIVSLIAETFKDRQFMLGCDYSLVG